MGCRHSGDQDTRVSESEIFVIDENYTDNEFRQRAAAYEARWGKSSAPDSGDVEEMKR
jgi:hypothetical protein